MAMVPGYSSGFKRPNDEEPVRGARAVFARIREREVERRRSLPDDLKADYAPLPTISTAPDLTRGDPAATQSTSSTAPLESNEQRKQGTTSGSEGTANETPGATQSQDRPPVGTPPSSRT